MIAVYKYRWNIGMLHRQFVIIVFAKVCHLEITLIYKGKNSIFKLHYLTELPEKRKVHFTYSASSATFRCAVHKINNCIFWIKHYNE